MGAGNSGLFRGTYGANINFPTNSPNYSNSSIKGTKTDFFVGQNGKVLPAQYKKWIGKNRGDYYYKKAKNSTLKNAIKQLYRSNSFIGDGGTASVIKFEKRTGLSLGNNGNTHIQKGKEMTKYIKNKILSNSSLSKSDRKLATKMYKKLLKALGE